ncbi:hypothetical protein [Pedobacter sp. ASV28]|nr:hypothetical protein [Pedobacter sp. ASV28]
MKTIQKAVKDKSAPLKKVKKSTLETDRPLAEKDEVKQAEERLRAKQQQP